MVSTTFENLNVNKKNKIIDVLIKEFSEYPLSDSKVSRIVKGSDIARGAFYKYFSDLNDAYQYVYDIAIKHIHADFERKPNVYYAPEKYLSEVSDFVNQVTNSHYFDLIKMHITTNEALLAHSNRENVGETFLDDHVDADTWTVAVLTHETIKQVLLYPESQEFLLKRYFEAIKKLDHKELK